MEQDRDAAAAEQAKAAFLKLPLEGLLEAYKGFVAELPKGRYDVFLSHAADDATQVDALRAEMTALDLRVYVDRFDDTLPARDAVNRKTADMLRSRMRACSYRVWSRSSRGYTRKPKRCDRRMARRISMRRLSASGLMACAPRFMAHMESSKRCASWLARWNWQPTTRTRLRGH